MRRALDKAVLFKADNILAAVYVHMVFILTDPVHLIPADAQTYHVIGLGLHAVCMGYIPSGPQLFSALIHAAAYCVKLPPCVYLVKKQPAVASYKHQYPSDRYKKRPTPGKALYGLSEIKNIKQEI